MSKNPFNNKYRVQLVLFIGLCFGITSCYYDNEEELYPGGYNCDTISVSFVNDLQPILTTSCTKAGCHIGSTPAAGISLETYAGVRSVAIDGRLAAAVSHSGGATAMPYNEPKLPACKVNTIVAWVNQGASNN